MAKLYQVETRALKQAVRRNASRFPDDFMFELTLEEDRDLRSQNVTLKRGQHTKYPPMAFTEQGVAMLSSVLNSERAIQVNIQIMRAFTKLRQMIFDNAELRKEIEELRSETEDKFKVVFEALDQLLAHDEKPKKKIGFTAKEKKGEYGEDKRSIKY
ncbi:MAG: ORF6N domain-containing protein [Desulfovermiculus sp.]|nr:ORF6N domain-containing protein [Desulfovermiculus sp.]